MLLPVYLILCVFIGILGCRHRLLGFWGVFTTSLLLTPLIGFLVVILSNGGLREQDSVSTEKEKTAK